MDNNNDFKLDENKDVNKKSLVEREFIERVCSTEFLSIIGEYNNTSNSGLSGYGLDLI